MTQQQRSFAELEAGCAEISEYNPVLVPGLLQTPDYASVRIASARQVDEDAGDPEAGEDIDTEVQARLARQSLLTREPTRPATRRCWRRRRSAAGPGRRRCCTSSWSSSASWRCCRTCTLHVLPRDTQIGDWYLPPTAFSVYRFADPLDPETLAIEGGFTDVMSTEAITLNRYKVVFEWLCTAALSDSDTLSWLIEATGRLTGTATPVHSGVRAGNGADPTPPGIGAADGPVIHGGPPSGRAAPLVPSDRSHQE